MLMFLAAVLVWGRPHSAPAALAAPFAPVYAVNDTGAVVLRGNANLTCDAGASGRAGTDCAAAKHASGAGGQLNNNAYKMIDVDTDGTPATFNSSSAELTVPAAATVLYAGLFWSADSDPGTGSGAPDPGSRNKVKFKVPGEVYRTITADDFDTVTTFPGHSPYQGYADVSALVAGAGSGTYTVADIQVATHTNDRYAGWTLAVVLHDPAQPVRNLVVYDGFGAVRGVSPEDATLTIPVAGFQTPQTGQVTTRLGAAVYEGDLGSGGDDFKLNGTALHDGLNPADNFFNSTVSEFGSPVTGRSPANANLFGVDIDQIDAGAILGNGQQRATITLDTTLGTGETVYPGVITFATDLYAPRLTATKQAVDVNGGTLQRGDEIQYTISVSNDGLAAADDTQLVDAVPQGSTFVPGSLAVAGAAQSDPADADKADLTGGATHFSLGSVPVGGAATARYRVTADGADPGAVSLLNVAHVAYLGAGTGVKLRALSNPVTLRLPALPAADLAVTATAAPGAVQSGGGVTYTLRVLNIGPDPAMAVRLVATLPAGVHLTGSTPDAGTCTAAGQTLTCTAGSLAAGATLHVAVTAGVTGGAAHSTVLTAVADAATDDPYTSNNTRTATLARNAAPVVLHDAATVAAHAGVSVPVLGNDSDPDGDTLRLLGIATPPGSGHAVVAADGTVRYTAGATTGTDTFTYTAGDGLGGTATGTVTVTVTAGPAPTPDAPPVANADSVTPGTFDVRANDTDADGDPLTVLGTGSPAHGSVTLGADGRLTYTPVGGYRGADSFQYTIGDGHGGTAGATVSVTVADRPPVAAPDVVSTAAGTAAGVAVLADDTDPDALDVLAVRAYDATSAQGGSVADAGGVLRYTPAAGFTGTDTFHYTVTDGNGGSATGTVTVHVLGAPRDDAANTQTATPVRIAVLANDDGASAVASAGQGAHGTVAVNGDGTVTYTPTGGYSGVDTFLYTVTDGLGGRLAARVTVTVLNAAPVGVPDTLSTPAGTTAVVPVLANDTDPNGDALQVADATGAVHGTLQVSPAGTVTYTPAAGYRGADGFTYTLSDANGAVSTATVALTVANRAPLALADSAGAGFQQPVTVPVAANDSDPDGDPVTVTAAGVAAHGTAVVNGDGTVTYTPAAGFSGTDTFSYTVSDPFAATATATVTVSVSAAAAPIVLSTPTVTTAQNSPGQPVDLLEQVTGAAGGPLSVLNVTQPRHGKVVLAGDGTATYRPDPGYTGADTFTYTVTDGSASTTGTVRMVVAAPLAVTGPAAQPHALAGLAALLLGLLLTVAAQRPGSRVSALTRRRRPRRP